MNLMLVTVLIGASLCSAAQELPRGRHAAIVSPAILKLYDVVVNDTRRLDAVTYPRQRIPNLPAQKKLMSSMSDTMILKRTILSLRQTCNAGYGYCYSSGLCCPDANGDGQCCDDGSCVTSTDTCCTGGGVCHDGKDCCGLNGCKPSENACCADGGSCEPGKECCGYGHCSPVGGECCADESYCKPGLHCVIYNGVQKCCEDLECGGGGSGGEITSRIPSTSSPSTTITSTTLPPTTTSSIEYFTYYTTWTWYYYSFYLTLTFQASEESITSTRLTSTTIISVTATNAIAADVLFSSLSVQTTFPTATTDPAVLTADISNLSGPSTPHIQSPTSKESSTSRSSRSILSVASNTDAGNFPTNRAGRTFSVGVGESWVLGTCSAVISGLVCVVAVWL